MSELLRHAPLSTLLSSLESRKNVGLDRETLNEGTESAGSDDTSSGCSLGGQDGGEAEAPCRGVIMAMDESLLAFAKADPNSEGIWEIH